MKRKVLVLGAGGYVGQRVVAALAQGGWAQPLAGVRERRGGAVGVVQLKLDATDPEALAAALAHVHGVVNCVSGGRETIVANAAALVRAAGTLDRPPRLVHLSSLAAYGEGHGRIDESAPLRGDLGAYSAGKRDAEAELAAYPARVVLRPGCIYGPGSPQWSERIARWLIARRIGDLGAAGDGASNAVYIDDVVHAIVEALQRPELDGQAFNLASPEAWRWNDYFIGYARALGAVPVRRIPAARLWRETHLWAVPLKLAERLLGGPRPGLPEPIPPSLAALWRRDLALDSSRASHVLGLRWTSMHLGLAKTAAARRAHRVDSTLTARPV